MRLCIERNGSEDNFEQRRQTVFISITASYVENVFFRKNLASGLSIVAQSNTLTRSSRTQMLQQGGQVGINRQKRSMTL